MVSPRSLGLRLATALVDEAKRLSPGGVTLLVNKDNARAIRFYERNGFACRRGRQSDLGPAGAANDMETVIVITGLTRGVRQADCATQ